VDQPCDLVAELAARGAEATKPVAAAGLISFKNKS
tara:strand:- start:263 stop:367 length:105 start_codon:yes stop_codon:yes gene_type:complete